MTLGRLGELREVLARSGVDLSQEELLDALWLARHLPPDAAPLARTALPAAHPPPPGPRPETPPAPAHPAAAPADAPAPEPPQAPAPGLPLAAAARADDTEEEEPAPALAVRIPDSRHLGARELRLGKSLRPLRRRFPDHRRHELDIARTVAAMADTGLPETVTRRVRSRWLSLALLVDDGISMVLWQRLAGEVRALMERAGAFRDIRVYGLDTRSAAAPLLSTSPYRGSGPGRSPASVGDPTGGTLVLVISDGVGEAWWDGRMRAATDLWARRGPTAIVHALPTRLWPSSGISAQRWQVGTRRRGGPTLGWQVTDPVLPPELAAFDAAPVPVLEPTPAAIADWARLIAAPGATAQIPLWNIGPALSERAYADTRQGDGAEAVLRFRAAASPEAYRLAAHLAAVAPLTPPVMRLVRTALGPPIDAGHLTEVFLGGLMRQIGADGPACLPHHRLFDFSAEARRILLGALAPRELLRTTAAVADHLESAVGRSPHFPAWVGHPDGTAVIGDAGRSFGWLKDRLLRRLGVPPLGAAPRALSGGGRRIDEAPEAEPLDAAARAFELPDPVPADLPPGWLPLLPKDPRRLGRFRLYARSGRGWHTVAMYLARDEDGSTVSVRMPAPRVGLPREPAADLVRTEAHCLSRMLGTYTPELLDWNTDDPAEPPWLAASYITRREDDPESGPAPNLRDVLAEAGGPVWGDPFLRIARDLTVAVGLAHSLGLVHGALAPGSVLVTDRGSRLVGWMTATYDGVHSAHRAEFPRSETYLDADDDAAGPTTEADVHALGALLLGLATGRWRDPRADTMQRAVLADSEIEGSLLDLLWRCLSRDPAERPTAAELAEAFASTLAGPGPRHWQEEALASLVARVERYRALVGQPPGSYRSDFAGSLNELSNQLGYLGRSDEALAAVTEAVQLCRQVVKEPPPFSETSDVLTGSMYERMPDQQSRLDYSGLARCLNNLSVRLGDTGRSEESLAAILEGVSLYRELAARDPAVYRSGLATALDTLANRLGGLGRHADGLATATEAVALYRQLADEDRARFQWGLARSLNNLANRLGAAGRADEALAAATEAVHLYREQARRDPEEVRPELASVLSNIAVRLGVLGREEEASAALDEAIGIRQALAREMPEAHEEDLRQSLRVRAWLRRSRQEEEPGSAAGAVP
ncbi:tetratricopeptide repeat-containing protein kinase family protein [Streptomyces sp. NBC_00239]|uniref:tetratricopeptide repeat-containing protein kinase family protein n=1 Tax=Streptomyces sp. NBC_00239 TaxID=2903640 RepID=UPI002E2CEB0B|nr:tetratricopeptide repeat-containing protein kinase family protein [Streptomyces sp. NBC_00239]